MSGVYYNEIDPFAAAWLRDLTRMGIIPDGEVDERDIHQVCPEDLVGFAQCHFFAGIGGWAFALKLAEWPENREVWTASCPCLPHSSAARGRTVAPDLWPPLSRLLVARTPDVLFGEQVAGAGVWFDGVCDDLEAMDYEVASAILPACSVGADHARHRIYFVGDTYRYRQSRRAVHAEVDRLPRYRGQSRRVAMPDGFSRDVGEMRAYGNAIHPRLAQVFIEAYLDCDEG